MNKINRRTLKISAVFSIIIFILLCVTMALGGVIAMFLYKSGILNGISPGIAILGFAGSSVCIGYILSVLIGKRILSSIIEISEATKEVAKGNFSVVLSENARAEEVRAMAQNFNTMTRELDSMEIFRNDFIDNVSHEFKTPLSAIEGYATLLQNRNLSEDRRQTYVSEIIYSTRKLSALTGNILQLSRLESQEMPVEKKHFSLDEQLRETILLFQQDWDAKNVELDVDLDTAEYNGNPDLLGQVWQNLLGNAIKFIEPGGTIRVLMYRKTREITVSVIDNGPGMDQETQTRIFEKFYQGDSSHSVEGNGLGLTLSKRIVELHGGKISVSSIVGKGTTFTVTLPCSQ